jgi:hypothetical protein
VVPNQPPEQVATPQDRTMWEVWQGGLTVRPTLLAVWPPLRVPLVLDNLTGHKTPAFV